MIVREAALAELHAERCRALTKIFAQFSLLAADAWRPDRDRGAHARLAAAYRLELALGVRQVSPLLVDVAESERIDLAAAVMAMGPVLTRKPLLRLTPRSHRRSVASLLLDPMPPSRRRYALTEDDRFRRYFRDGLAIRPPSHPDGALGLRVSRDDLQACFHLGGVKWFVAAAAGSVLVPGEFPETVLASMIGRELGDVIDHAFLRRRAYRIREATSLSGARTLLRFSGPRSGLDLLASLPEAFGSIGLRGPHDGSADRG